MVHGLVPYSYVAVSETLRRPLNFGKKKHEPCMSRRHVTYNLRKCHKTINHKVERKLRVQWHGQILEFVVADVF
jgi:hypothetical protein